MTTHFKAAGYGYIVPNIAYSYITGGSGAYDTLTVFSDLDTVNYAEMYPGGTLPAGSRYYLVKSDPLGSIDHFYRASDSNGTPTSTAPPESLTTFMYYKDLGAAFGMDFYPERVSDALGYSAPLYAPPVTGDWAFLDGADYVGNASLLAALASNNLTLAIDATGPADVSWLLSAFGLRYPLIGGIPPLRQWPRDDGLRRTPGRTQPSSRQGSLRRGPRGTYT